MSDEPQSVLDVPGALHAHDAEHVKVAVADDGTELPQSVRFPFIPAWYGLYFVGMCKTARECGYALALHGSLQRDCDTIAAPWTEAAVSAEDLIARLVERHGLMLGNPGDGTAKPHRRRAWSLHMGGHFYFDVSVMPRSAP